MVCCLRIINIGKCVFIFELLFSGGTHRVRLYVFQEIVEDEIKTNSSANVPLASEDVLCAIRYCDK